MTMQAVNLDTYSLSLLTAKEDIVNPRSSTNWALFTYDGVSNKLKLADSGVGGVAELAGKFHISKPQYGLCTVGTADTGGPRIAMISWVGKSVDDYRRTECAGHMPAIRNFFKEVQAFVSAETLEDVTEEKIAAELNKVLARAPAERVRRSSRSVEKEETVGTNYRKTNAAMEMRRINRDSFWARAEREEEQRKDEERRRAAEERRRLERERVLKERREADERDRKMNEKLQMIEEQRRKQAEQEEQLRRQEKSRWDQQQREHEEDMRARLRRSESIEKAAEAAVLVSQRSMNPREFFRQLSSSSQGPTSPGSPRTGKPPLRRYQRSLTDTAFIFSKSEEVRANSLRSPPLRSAFSRGPPSPLYRTTSPPASPDFRPITSPQRPQAPMMSPPTSPLRPTPPVSALPMMSPPTSPLRPTPPVSALPSVPLINHQVEAPAKPKSPSPTQPSAPPASPSLLASMASGLPTELQAAALPPSPPMTPPQDQAQTQTILPSPPNSPTQPQPEHSPLPSVCLEPGLAPQTSTAPLPESPQTNTDLYTATHMQTELVSDTCHTVQAVLVEEDEEEEVEEKEEEKPEAQPCTITTEATQAAEEQEEEELKQEAEPSSLKEPVEMVLEEEKPEAQPCTITTDAIQAAEELKQEVEPASLEEPVEMVQEEGKAEEDEQNDQTDDSQPTAEPVVVELSEREEESAVTDAEAIFQQIKEETVVLVSTNGITNGNDIQEQNGIERSMSPSDTELSSPELVCYDLHSPPEEYDDVAEDEEQEISENGQAVTPEQQMCVRALYDYQAEDESEISFEPGDIIRDVETVDKAWWRGCSKDGRQGLFPANYVETI